MLGKKSAAKTILDNLPPLYPHQQKAINHLTSYVKHPCKCKRKAYKSPTGTGKSYLALTGLALHHATGWLVTPSVEIIYDMFRKIGVECKGPAELESLMMKYHIITPIRLRNRLMDGTIQPEDIEILFIDECHHAEADTYKLLKALLPDGVIIIGFTATPFRGTPLETKKFRDEWGEVYEVISMEDAIAQGFYAMPDVEIWPLVDDDLCEIGAGGEFVVSSVTAETKDKLHEAIKTCHQRGIFTTDGLPTRPTVIGIHSSEIIPYLERVASDIEYPVKLVFITDETPSAKRQEYFAGCLDLHYAIVHINTVSEGVDISSEVSRLRVYIDFASTNSPLRFTQRFGRICRSLLETESQPPLYICTNRNVEKHGYILEGCLPADVVKKAQLAFPRPTERVKARAFGVESLGRIKPTKVLLQNGLTVSVFAVSQMQGNMKVQYLVVVHPNQIKPAWLYKKSFKEGEEMKWGKWDILRDIPTELKGFKSSPPGPLTEGQQRFWNSCAKKCGLDETQPIDGKKFQLMPALVDVGVCLA